ncbi:MAG TPA: Na+/H+ antiporter NhaA, partial [Candidatus Kapabacteria bacterium]|nr:Na+/H+ antiporter NhaA [Candidatus Kapabacteria bacterium]
TQRPVLFESVYKSFERFFKTEVASGIVLLASTVIALIWANSPWAESYEHVWHLPLGFYIGEVGHAMSLAHWINDGLMAIFFLAVGLEIKHELFIGRLSSFRRAALPFVAALGGMIVPAAIYAIFNSGTDAIRGWGIPMATDIAFSLGVIALLGKSIPTSIRVFVAALAIVDDLGAVLVIALFYTAEINFTALAWAGVFTAILFVFNRLRVSKLTLYLLVGIALWWALYFSGIHATIAGVVVGMLIPHRAKWTTQEFMLALEDVRDFVKTIIAPNDIPDNEETRQSAVHSIEKAAERVQSPLSRLSHGLHPIVAFFIIPLFALANAGLAIRIDAGLFSSSVFWGVALGLLVGKTIGISLFSFAAVRMKLAELPSGVNWLHMVGAAILCGIGFTMSLFIGELALGGHPEDFAIAKLSILLASLVAGILGFVLLKSQRTKKA